MHQSLSPAPAAAPSRSKPSGPCPLVLQRCLAWKKALSPPCLRAQLLPPTGLAEACRPDCTGCTPARAGSFRHLTSEGGATLELDLNSADFPLQSTEFIATRCGIETAVMSNPSLRQVRSLRLHNTTMTATFARRECPPGGGTQGPAKQVSKLDGDSPLVT